MFLRITQPGRNRYVLTHLILPPDFNFKNISKLDAFRHETLTELKKYYKPVMPDMIFTSDKTLYVMDQSGIIFPLQKEF